MTKENKHDINDRSLTALSLRIKDLEDWREKNREAFQKAVDDLVIVKQEFEAALAAFKENSDTLETAKQDLKASLAAFKEKNGV